ncbi:MAG: alpha/beta hydrolase [Bacteroidetes bacterium]|nr:alpha/beta hydrolase [Bacteroidota bacterium]
MDKEKGNGFFENMWLKPIRNNEWDTYTIEGTIDTGAYQIAFGALCQYNGKFFYDDVKMDIETKENQWENIFSDDFEGNTHNFKQGIQRWRSGFNENYSAEIYKNDAAQGNECLLIIGEGVPNFGVNSKTGKFATVNGIQLYYEVYGTGQPLVILHGNGGSIMSATSHYPHFIDNNYKVIAIDSRAQGKSGDTEKELSYDLLASDINELLNQLNLDSVYLWGYSDGAIVGLVMALKYPEKIKKMVAFAPNIKADSTAIEPPIYRWIEKTALNSKSLKRRKLADMMWKHPNIPFSELNKIQSEIILLSGDRDFVTLRHTLEIFKNLPKVQLCIIPGSTHYAPWAKKELFLQIVDDFFEKPFHMPSTVQLIEQ